MLRDQRLQSRGPDRIQSPHPQFGLPARAFFAEMYRTIAHGGCWKGTICNRAKSGTLYWVDTTIVPQLDDTGRPVGCVSIRFDVTEHVKALEALAESKSPRGGNRPRQGSLSGERMAHELRTARSLALWAWLT
ncbi:PAS domain-containing protein [Caulobacter segnis]